MTSATVSSNLWRYMVGSMLAVVPCVAQAAASLTEKEAEFIAIEAYIYGYPLVTMDLTRQVMTNTVESKGTKAPMGQFANLREYPNPSFKDVTTPNADTLYSSAWLDLSNEPYILHVPNENGRYYLMPILSAWTNVIASPGTRATGTDAKDFAITGPNWQGSLPKGVREIKSPTNLVWIIGRTYCTGTPEDYDVVHEIQNQYSLKPLSYYNKSYTPPKGSENQKVDMKTPVREQVNHLDAQAFFSRLAALMKDNPPGPKDGFIVKKMASIGIFPGQEFDLRKLDPAIAKGVEKAPKMALERIMGHEHDAGKVVNGWSFVLKTGHFGTDYLQRAFVAATGLGANLAQDAIYPVTRIDSSGKPLNGAHQYVIHFPKGQMPPANGFWSLTLYDDKLFFVPNKLNRYALSQRNLFKENRDGSIDLYVQHQSPGHDKESNWLPAPEGNFVLMLRCYWPREALLNGSWNPPAVQKVKK